MERQGQVGAGHGAGAVGAQRRGHRQWPGRHTNRRRRKGRCYARNDARGRSWRGAWGGAGHRNLCRYALACVPLPQPVAPTWFVPADSSAACGAPCLACCPAAAPITPAVPAVGVATPARLADDRRRNSAPAVVPANVGVGGAGAGRTMGAGSWSRGERSGEPGREPAGQVLSATDAERERSEPAP